MRTYMSLKVLELGILPTKDGTLWTSRCDPGLVAAIELVANPERVPGFDPSEVGSWNAARARAGTRLNGAIEDQLRADFGIKPRGEERISETVLFRLVRELFPADEVLRNDRPPWLRPLELDVHIPALRLALEYQGEQHYRVVRGDEETLKRQQARDAQKRFKCAQHGVVLIEVPYTQKLTRESIEALLSAHGFGLA